MTASAACGLIDGVTNLIINPLIALLFALGLIVFLWGVVEFIFNSADSEGRESGKKHILWGIVGMFIMFVAFGIIITVLNTFGIVPAIC